MARKSSSSWSRTPRQGKSWGWKRWPSAIRTDFTEWLGDFARDYGVEAMVADDLNTCKPAVERLGIERQICIARVRKRARSRLDGIDGWDWVKARIWRLLTELSFDGDLELPRLERAVRDRLDMSDLIAAQRRALC